MNKRCLKVFSRFLVLFLSFALALPNQALALRTEEPKDAGLEQKLAQALTHSSTAGLEEKKEISDLIRALIPFVNRISEVWLGREDNTEMPPFPEVVRQVLEDYPKAEKRVELGDLYYLFLGTRMPLQLEMPLPEEEILLSEVSSILALLLVHYGRDESLENEVIFEDLSKWSGEVGIMVSSPGGKEKVLTWIQRTKEVVGLSAAGLEEKELAELAQVVTDYLPRQTPVTVEELKEMARLLEIPLEQLLKGRVVEREDQLLLSPGGLLLNRLGRGQDWRLFEIIDPRHFSESNPNLINLLVRMRGRAHVQERRKELEDLEVQTVLPGFLYLPPLEGEAVPSSDDHILERLLALRSFAYYLVNSRFLREFRGGQSPHPKPQEAVREAFERNSAGEVAKRAGLRLEDLYFLYLGEWNPGQVQALPFDEETLLSSVSGILTFLSARYRGNESLGEAEILEQLRLSGGDRREAIEKFGKGEFLELILRAKQVSGLAVKVGTIKDLGVNLGQVSDSMDLTPDSRVLLLPAQAKPAKPQPRTIILFSHQAVAETAKRLLSKLSPGVAIEIHEISDNDPAETSEKLSEAVTLTSADRMILVALNADDLRFREIRYPQGHSLILLMKSGVQISINPTALNLLLAQPNLPANLVINLTTGEVPKITLPTEENYYLFV